METIMKNRTLIAALVLITLSGCVSLGEYVGNTPLPVRVYRCPLELRTVDTDTYSTGRLLTECEYDPDISFLYGDTYRGLRVIENEDYPYVRFLTHDIEVVRDP